jgi:glucose-1-phosphate thymidylyltransferase
MRGIILAGGLGSRLLPLTKVTNKHLLPVYDKPMIYFPLETLRETGIEEVMIVTGDESSGDFLRLLGNGSEIGLKHLEYTYQEGALGIAHALGLCERFAREGPLCVMLGDNIVQSSIRSYRQSFEAQGGGARLLIKEVADPERFGVPEILEGRIVGIEEKPPVPKSRYAVTGIYFYDNRVFEFIRRAKPSARNELEITDVNNAYIAIGALAFDVLEGWWSDAGQFESLYRASRLVRAARCRQAP